MPGGALDGCGHGRTIALGRKAVKAKRREAFGNLESVRVGAGSPRRSGLATLFGLQLDAPQFALAVGELAGADAVDVLLRQGRQGHAAAVG